MATLGQDLLRFKTKKYLQFDTETESLNLHYSRPWQLSWTIAENGRILKEQDFYIWWPDLNISEDAKRITQFNYSKYQSSAVPPEKVAEIFYNDFNNEEYILIGHNIFQFDIYQLNTLRREIGLRPDWGFMDRSIDTLALARAYRSNSHAMPYTGKSDFTAWQYRMLTHRVKKCSLKEMGKEFDIPFDESLLHDAKYDNSLGIKVFEKLKWAVEI